MILLPLVAFAGGITAVAMAAGARSTAKRTGTRRQGKTRNIAVREATKVGKAKRALRKARQAVKQAEKKAAKDVAKARRKTKEAKRGKAKRPPKPSGKDAERTGHKVRIVDAKKLPKPDGDKKKKDKKESARLKPKKAAEQMYRYVKEMVAAGKSHLLGSRDKPNERVKKLQGDMRRLKEDGQYGDETRARGKELTGRDFPIRRHVKRKDRIEIDYSKKTAPEPPKPDEEESDAGRAEEEEDEVVTEEEEEVVTEDADDEQEEGRLPKVAADDLLSYVRGLGKKGTPGRAIGLGFKNFGNPTVKLAQADMGGLVKDGIYGNKTRARGKELTGETFPAR